MSGFGTELAVAQFVTNEALSDRRAPLEASEKPRPEAVRPRRPCWQAWRHTAKTALLCHMRPNSGAVQTVAR